MAKPAKNRPTASSPTTDITLNSSKRPAPRDPGTKQSRILTMLRSPAGVTIDAMMKATDWQPHSVRGFLAGVVRKRLKLKLKSKKVDGERVYLVAAERGDMLAPRRSKARTR